MGTEVRIAFPRALWRIGQSHKSTANRVYRFIFKQGKPVGILEVQRGLRLSAPSGGVRFVVDPRVSP